MLEKIRSICDILIFKSPFEDDYFFLDKFKKINQMFEDYILNSGIFLQKNSKENENYNIFEFINSDFDIKIIFSFKKDLNSKDYFPSLMINYFLNDLRFEKSNIESFLNDNIKFIFNVFFEDFFIDYDQKFNINDINKGKKVNYENLSKFNLEKPNSKENNEILDSLMYIHFNLIKSIFDIESNNENLNEILKFGLSQKLSANLELSQKKQDLLKQKLISSYNTIKFQIDSFIDLIGKK